MIKVCSWNRFKIREIYTGQYQTSILYISAGDYNLGIIFWQGPFFKDALFENGAKSHSFTNLFYFIFFFGEKWKVGKMGARGCCENKY